MSTRKVVIITAAAIAGLIAAGLIVLALVDIKGGTPIIIKGGSEPNRYVEIGFDKAPAGGGNTVTVDGGFDTVKVIDAVGHCAVYDFTGFGSWSSEIQLTTTSASGAPNVVVDDTLLAGVETTFDRAKFTGTPGTDPTSFKSNEHLKVTGLVIFGNLTEPDCKDKNTDNGCPREWPYLEGLEIWINYASPTCPPPP